MRELLNQDRALAPATIRLAIRALGLLFVITAIIIVINGLRTIFGGEIDIGFLQISGGVGVLLALFLIVRLQAEAVMAAHRTNDRLMILTDALSPREDKAPSKPAPAAKKPTPRKTTPVKPKAAAIKPARTKPVADNTDS